MSTDHSQLRTQNLLALDSLCDAFESRWQAGDRPTIEDYLAQSAAETRAELLEELLALEISFHNQQGEILNYESYRRRFPEFDTVVQRVFTDLAWQQQTKVDQDTSIGRVEPHPRSLGVFGTYDLLAEIGRGGMGVVYKAYQPSLDRTVAIKMILAGQSTPQLFVERFRTEARTLAKLAHPGIVPIFEVGEVQGQHFFSMEYVEGESLAQRITAGPIPPREAARITREVADIIHFAHEQGVLHRDIKPSNILVSPQGRTRVMDFGLAKQVEGDSQNTRSGEVLGTPSYMSPEQASGRWREVDRRSDVYSLGAVLYALLMRRPPFQGDSPVATLLSVLEGRLVSPSTVNTAVEPELERICMKCLDKDPTKRYPTAAALAQDLEQFLKIDPTTVVAPIEQTLVDPLDRSRRTPDWVAGAECTHDAPGNSRSKLGHRESLPQPPIKRPSLLVVTVAAAVVIWATVFTIDTPQGTLVVDVPDNVHRNLQVRATKDGAVEVADSESKWSIRLKEGKYALLLEGGDDQFQMTADSIVVMRNKEAHVRITHKKTSSSPRIAPRSVESAKSTIPANSSRTFAKQERLGKLALVEQPAEIKDVLSWTIESTAHRAAVTELAYHPSGTQVISCGRDGTLRIWEVSSGKMQRVLVSADELESCDISHDGQYVAACGNQRLEIWEVAAGRLLKNLALESGRPSIIRWSPDGRFVACAIDKRGVQIWDVVAGSAIDVLPAAEPVGALAWNHDSSQIAFATEKNGIEIYRVASGERVHRLQAAKDHITSLAWSDDSAQLLASGATTDAGGHGVRIWSLTKSPTSREITGMDAVVTQVSWQDNDKKMLVVLDNGQGELRDAESGSVVRKYENRSAVQHAVTIWSRDGSSAASADASGAILFRTTRTGSEIRRDGLAVHYASPTWNNSMPALAWSSVGNTIALATPNALNESTAAPGLWRMAADISFQSGQGTARHHLIVSLAWSDDGELLATGGSDPQTIIWNKDGTQRQILQTGGWVSSLGFEPKSHRLAVGTQGGEIHLWDLEKKTAKKLASPHKSWVTFRWSADGKQIASAGYDGKVSLWNVESGEAICTISKDGAGNELGHVHCVDLSPDGKDVAAGSADRVWIFRADRGEQAHLLAAGGWVYGVRFSPDGKRLAGGSGDGKLRIWNAGDGKLERELPQPQPVTGVAWSPGGEFVACATSQRVSVYQPTGEKQVDLIPLGMNEGLAISPAGHVRTTNRNHFVYVLQTADGQVTVDAKEMGSRWGWKNDPQRVQAR